MNTKSLALLAGVAVLLGACSNTDKPDNTSAVSNIIPGSVEDFEANVANTIYFEFDSSELTEAARRRLDSQVCWLRLYTTVKVVVEGRTDARGTRAYNTCLGAKRANAVKKYLVKNGVSKSRINVISYGMDRIEYPGDTEEIHAKNRNCKTVVINIEEAK